MLEGPAARPVALRSADAPVPASTAVGGELTRPRVGTDPALFPIEARSVGYTAPDGAELLRDLSLKLDGRQRTVIMGPNGAGKSLLLRVLHGLVRPTRGEVLWAGKPATEAVRARQAMVFQKPTLLRRSAEDNLRFVLTKVAGLAPVAAGERATAILERAHLAHAARTPARKLSGGEQQRLAIARALALAPEVLFLDEPCSGLDPASTGAVEEMIQSAHDHGTKIVIVTHDLGQARRLADEVVFVHRGTVIEHEPAARFFSEPASQTAQDYLAGRIPR